VLHEEIIGGFYKVDIFLKSRNTIIEVNGQRHFNGFGKLSKKSLTKERILTKLGYKYVNLTAILNWDNLT
jgi:very-short-patch-repair endonuclease